ncbi:PREDICTED: cilia- and flagella-associated protein 61-like [Polistes canadensis]|uniref:cilia- and flagella-associated protein 61-like n=1 Tax=Polistes canadensis TaxID=91411 RepID=UPI000718BFE8|nr:PREDICTED: cilia- and flagella-associated protein 61-like [Polistes canadensis]
MFNIGTCMIEPNTGRCKKEYVPRISGYRRALHSDLPTLERLISIKTYDIFGNIDIGQLYESSCYTVIQYNEKEDIISGIFLCNYPNIPSIPKQEWLHCLTLHYKIVPIDFKDTFMVQALYLSTRYTVIPRLKIRRAVEEDNDDIIPIIDADSSYVKELYGEYYISEMIRYPDGHRQLIVSEDDNGLTTGVICLNSNIDVDILNENFELNVYRGLRKPHETDDGIEIFQKSTSEILSKNFSGNMQDLLSDNVKLERKSSAMIENKIETKTNFENDEKLQTNDTEIKEIYNRKVSLPKEKKHVRISEVYNNDEQIIEETFHESKDEHFVMNIKNSDKNVGSMIPDHLNVNVAFADAINQIPTLEEHHFVRSKSNHIEQKIFTIPNYYGKVNAFVIEMFAVRDDIGNRGTREFLETTFECFPDLDYCVLLLPSAYSYFSFLEQFVRVPLRCNKDFPMSLYLSHKAVLFGEIKSYKANLSDRTKIEKFLISDNTIIGLAIVCIEKDHEELKKNFHVEDFITRRYIFNEAYGRLLHFVLMPIFSINQRYFFCEIMRLNDLTILYYRLYEEEGSSLTRTQSLVSCLHTMVPVNPRRRIEYKFCDCSSTNNITDEIYKNTNNNKVFTLFMTTPRIATIPNKIIDTKIVVVGGSDCGIAFVEFLALGYQQNFVNFTNLTLISPNGLPYEKKHNDLKWDMMIPFKGKYCRDYRHLITRRAWINVVYGTLLAINRKEKYVTVMDQGNLSYDFLILTCGLQYQKTLFRDKKMETQKEGDITKSEIIWNCLTINDDVEAYEAIVFYGHNIDCYCALHGLLKHGIKGSWITLIEPKLKLCDRHDNVFFYNCEVDTTIMNSILENEINILLGWNVINWNLLEECKNNKNKITSIVVRSGNKIRTIPCDIFFNFYNKQIDTNSFLETFGLSCILCLCFDRLYANYFSLILIIHIYIPAICRAGLVFDGRLVINPEFRTNDPFVFAAGAITKYSRKFQAELFEHKYYSSIEIGERLGKVIRKVIEIYQERKGRCDHFDRSKSNLLLPEFRSPIIVSCVLPGDYHYLYVSRPGNKLPRDISIKQSLYGDVMITGNCLSEIGYFRLRVNSRNFVDSITCCSKKNFEVHHMIALYGKHDSMLNEVKYRFKNSLILDFYAYFREPWAMALFYDRFECLRVENRATLLSKTNVSGGDSLIEDCVRALLKSEGNEISEKDRNLIEKKYVGSVYQQEIENSIVDFLQFSEEDLPVYCTPRFVRWLYADIESSPLFFEQ